jgi:eukaryotic-like serine/threonine-protein kinase
MSDKVFIRPGSGGARSSADAVARIAARGLPPDLLREASRRLEVTSLVVGAAFAVAILLNSLIRAGGWYTFAHPNAHNVVALTAIAVSGALAWLCRSGRVEPHRLLDVGLAYEVVIAFAISLGDNLEPLTEGLPLAAISWLCVWIVMFPLVVPATPGKALVASLAAATAWPLAYAIGIELGNPPQRTSVAALNVLENYIAAGLALVTAGIIRRLGASVEKAREMGSYELLERLDHGGMGEVWRARHRMLARPAAIKLIRPELLGLEKGHVAEALVRRFEREAQATAALHSPHTIELYDFGVTRDGTFYYVMELLDGLDLESLVRRFGPLPPERAIHLLVQACDSLADAHHAGLVHRDIKPANICACRRGLKDDFVKVLDFGLVKSAWEGAERDSHLTQEGAIAGTPAYMAPEMARGHREIDARADIYCLGCVAYWLVTGRTVFEPGTALQMALQHAQDPPVPPSRRSETPIPESLDRLILACLEKDPDRRPASAHELARALAACETGQPWSAARARKWWDTHRPAAGHGDTASPVTPTVG